MNQIKPSDFVTVKEYQAARLKFLIEEINMMIMDDDEPFSRLAISYLTIAVSNIEIALMLTNSRFRRRG